MSRRGGALIAGALIAVLAVPQGARGSKTDFRCIRVLYSKDLPDLFVESVLATLGSWKFTPAELDREPVSVVYTMTVNARR